MPEEVAEAPVTLPESTTFDEYVAARSAHNNDLMAAVVEPDLVAEAPSPESGQTPEPTEPAPVEESTTAVAAEPAAPEPATEPVTVEETQEQKEQREKKQGIPQARLDEVTKARREAERDRDAKAAEVERLKQEVEALKAKPAEVAKPVEAVAEPETPKPVAPETPKLEDFGGDWDAYQVGLNKFNRETYPAYVEQLTDWKTEQRDIAKNKKAEETAAATRKQAEDAARAKVEQAEAEAQTDWKSRVQAVTDAHPDFLEKINATPASAAMVQAVQDMDNGPEFAYWLAQRPEEAKRIAEATGLGKELTPPQFRKALAKAHAEFAKFDTSEESQPAEVAAAPATTAVTPAPVSALPVNPKPNTTKAPRPPSPVQERGAAAVKDPAKATSFEEYEAARLAARTATRR